MENVFTVKDYQAFQDDNLGARPKLELMGTRLFKVGIRCPGEKILERCVAVLVCLGKGEFTNANADKRYTWCRELKAIVKSLDDAHGPHPFGHVANLQNDFVDLMCTEARSFAYGDEAPAPQGHVNMATLEFEFKRTWYRKSAAALKGGQNDVAATCAVQVARKQNPHDLQQQMAAAMMQSMTQAVGSMMASFGIQPPAGPKQPHIKIFDTPQKANTDSQSPATDSQGSVAPSSAAPPGWSAPGGSVSAAPGGSAPAGSAPAEPAADPLEELEAQVGALTRKAKNRTESKKVAAAAKAARGKGKGRAAAEPKGKAKAKAKAKAKTKAKATAKAPAKSNTRGSVTSRAYDSAVAKAKKKGASEEAAKALGRKAYAKAAAEWDSEHAA